MPSASHSENGPSLYEPIHSSAPDIAGQGIQSISMILSVSMMLRDSFDVMRMQSVSNVLLRQVWRQEF